MEVWKDIPSLPGYQASSEGRVRSTARIITTSNGRSYELPGKLLTPTATRMGYWRFGAGGKTASLHRAVLEAFDGPCPEGHEAAHNDGNRANNRPSNLRWATRVDNAADRKRHGTVYRPIGERHHLAKLTDKDVRAIRQDPRGHAEVARAYGVNKNAIFVLRKGKTWGHVQ